MIICFSFFWDKCPRIQFVGSYSNSMFSLRNNQIVFQNDYIVLLSHQHVWILPGILCFYCFLFYSKRCVVIAPIVLTGISLMAKDIKHLSWAFYTICISFSMKCLFTSCILLIFSLNYYSFKLLSFECPLHPLDTHLWVCGLQVFSYSATWVFILLTGWFAEQKFQILMKFTWSIFLLRIMLLVSSLKIFCLVLDPRYVLLCY